MVCTTSMSPMTVMTVVEVVGVMPSTQTSLGLPVWRQTVASCASGLSGLPVMTMNFSAGFRLWASRVSSTISRVLPELEMSRSRSFSCRMPRSPCCASLGCRKTEGMPVEQKVVAMFMAICPAFPMPEVTSFPLRRCTCSTMRPTAFSYASVTGMLSTACASFCKSSLMESIMIFFVFCSSGVLRGLGTYRMQISAIFHKRQ